MSQTPIELTDDQLLRYARNILMSDVDVAGQQVLLNSHVAVIGAGGLGSPIIQYLVAAGIGELTIIDDDVVDETNLQRQIIHSQETLNQSKVESAALFAKRLNPEVTVNARHEKFEESNAQSCLKNVDAVVIGTDNFESRYVANRFCRALKIPLITGAAIGLSGQITSFDFRTYKSPCLTCVYPEGQDEALNCSTSGVLGPVVGTIGSMQALEVIKVLLNIGTPLQSRLMTWDAKHMEWQTFQFKPNAQCPVCQGPVDSNFNVAGAPKNP